MIILASKIGDSYFKQEHKVVVNTLSSINTYLIKREEKGFKNMFISYYLTESQVNIIENALLNAGYQVKTTKGKIVKDDKMSVQFHLDWSKANVKTRFPDSKL